MIDLGHWTTALLITEQALPYGFIYVITNKLNGKKYFGKKQIKTIKSSIVLYICFNEIKYWV